MRAELVEAKAYHTSRISRSLRVDHRDLLLSMHVRIHREMRDMFDTSRLRLAWILNGELMAIGGITGTLASSEGIAWLAISESAKGHSLRVAREVSRQVKKIMETRQRLETIILKNDHDAIRFAYFLGFNVKQPTEIGGQPALIMSLKREVS